MGSTVPGVLRSTFPPLLKEQILHNFTKLYLIVVGTATSDFTSTFNHCPQLRLFADPSPSLRPFRVRPLTTVLTGINAVTPLGDLVEVALF